MSAPAALAAPRSGASPVAQLGPRVGRAIKSEPALAILVVLAAAAYSTFSLVRYGQLGNSGFDLGIFDQVIWHFSHFQGPESSVKGFSNIWGDHFSPILMLLAPLYWVWDDARVILLAQAALLALAAVPIFLYARDRVGRLPGYLLVSAYLVFWGVQSGVAFDFHELAFAPLITALVVYAVHQRRWRLYLSLVLALLAIKEDQSVLVVFLGIYLLTLGERRRGLFTIFAGVAWYLLVVGWLIPHVNPAHFYGFWSYTEFGSDPVSALDKAVTHPWLLITTLFDNSTKAHTLAYLFVPFLGLSLCSRTVILLVPLLAERFLSTTSPYWSTGGQYTLAIAGLLVIGAADGLANVLRRAPVPARQTAAVVVAALMLVLNVSFARGFPLYQLVHPSFYRTPVAILPAKQAIADIPGGVSVAVEDILISHLTHRRVAAEISARTGYTDYIAANVIAPVGSIQNHGGFGGLSRFVDQHLATYQPVAYHDGWLVLRSKQLPPLPRTAELTPMSPGAGIAFNLAYVGWARSLAEYQPQFVQCSTSGAGAVACLRRAGSRFRVQEARLQRQLAALRPTLSPGCRQLGLLASVAAQDIAQNLEGARRAALAAPVDSAALGRYSSGYQADTSNDFDGYVGRFAVLCEMPAPTAR